MFPRLGIWIVAVLLLMRSSVSLGQGTPSSSEWKALNERDIAKRARATRLSPSTVRNLLDLTEGEWNEENQYIIEDIDAVRLARRHQILLSTYNAGTGHCMRVYVVENRDQTYRLVQSDFEIKGLSNFCTESILGSATARATHDGSVVIKLPERVAGSPGKSRSEAQSELVIARFNWDGKNYKFKDVQRFRRYKWDGSDWKGDQPDK